MKAWMNQSPSFLLEQWSRWCARLTASGSARKAFAVTSAAKPAARVQGRDAAHTGACRRQFAVAHRGYRRRGANDWLLLATMLACLLLSLPTQAERLKDCLLYTSPSPRD